MDLFAGLFPPILLFTFLGTWVLSESDSEELEIMLGIFFFVVAMWKFSQMTQTARATLKCLQAELAGRPECFTETESRKQTSVELEPAVATPEQGVSHLELPPLVRGPVHADVGGVEDGDGKNCLAAVGSFPRTGATAAPMDCNQSADALDSPLPPTRCLDFCQRNRELIFWSLVAGSASGILTGLWSTGL